MSSEISRVAGVSAQMIAMSELDPAPGVIPKVAPDGGTAVPPQPAGIANPLRHLKVQLTVSVGSAELTVGELLAARAQQVLRLDRGMDQPVDVLLEGQVVARGILVAVGDQFGVRITELPVPLELPDGSGAKVP